MTTKDVIIIGGGPAGLTAAIYSSRALLDTLVITGGIENSQLFLSPGIEDYPGFLEIISGYDLLKIMRKQAEKFNSEFLDKRVIKVNLLEYPFLIIDENENQYFAKSVIIATGAHHRLLNLDKEKEFIGRGISVCAICDGPFYKDKIVAVVGGGDSAVKEALYLSKYAQKVYLLYRREKLKAAELFQKRAKEEPKIEFFPNCEVEKLLGENKLEGIIVKNKKEEKSQEIKIDGLFLAIGSEPATELFKNQLEILPSGHLKTNNLVKTSKEGVFAAGDVIDSEYRQAITAAGFGAIAALEAGEWLKSNGEK